MQKTTTINICVLYTGVKSIGVCSSTEQGGDACGDCGPSDSFDNDSSTSISIANKACRINVDACLMGRANQLQDPGRSFTAWSFDRGEANSEGAVA